MTNKTFTLNNAISESDIQKMVIDWATFNNNYYSGLLKWLHSSLNGVSLGGDIKSRMITINSQKARGLKKGIADLFLPLPKVLFIENNDNYCLTLYSAIVNANKRNVKLFNYLDDIGAKIISIGLYMELKTLVGKLTVEQADFLDYANSVGYTAVMCRGYDQTIDTIKDYLS